MSKFLVAISIGPVQDFIAAARRTRDLWFGSKLLSEISKAVAKKLVESGAALIFPYPEASIDLARDSSLSVANKILAEVPEGVSLKELTEKAEKAATDRWLEFADQALAKVKDEIEIELWNDQVGHIIEFYAAWAPISGDYAECRTRVERLLAGRKALRDFAQSNGKGAGIPKSSLDGMRESVLKQNAVNRNNSFLATKLKGNEQLDAVGLIKRLAGDDERFPSVIRVAVDSWVRGLTTKEKGIKFLNEMQVLCNEHKVPKTEHSCYQDFRYDGSVFYFNRLENFVEEGNLNPLLTHKVKELFQRYNIKKEFGEPSPYLAILIADGDRMGAAISAIDSAERHRVFSRKLSHFAGNAREIIENHHGVLVYSGGDDVMALLPVDQAIEAARGLHDNFGELMKEFPSADKKLPTLSVGIAIGHCLEPMGVLLDMARKAEKAAKGSDRDGLAIFLQTRSGGDPIQVRAQWSSKIPNLDMELKDYTDLYVKGSISAKAAYDLRKLEFDYLGWPKNTLDLDLLRSDCLRLFKKKRDSQGAPITEETINSLQRVLQNLTNLDDVNLLANKLLLSLHLADFKLQANPGIGRRLTVNYD